MNEEPPKERNRDIDPDGLIRTIGREPRDDDYWRSGKKRRSGLPRGIMWGVFGLILIFVGGSIVSFIIARNKAIEAATAGAANIAQGIQYLQALDPSSAKEQFSQLSGSGGDMGGTLGFLGDLFQTGGDSFGAVQGLSGDLGDLATKLNDIGNDTLSLVATGNGSKLLADLTETRKTLGDIDIAGTSLAGTAKSLGGFSPVSGDIYLPFKAQIGEAEQLLDKLIPWFGAEAPHHVLVMFENPSELRPGGGFLGSYADVTLAGGNITNVAVHDIADVDLAFRKNIVPPKPLQLEVARWRPADANWFLDFPTSAEKTIGLFEQSDLYAKDGTTFDAAIAVTPKVIEDLLAVTGPITVKGAPTFTSENFLTQTQSIVQAGQAQSATYPKKVLQDLATGIFMNLASSTDTVRQGLLTTALNWIEKKDVTAYFKDPVIEGFLASHAFSGAIYEMPQTFNGDYLAIANANINGDKSDLYVAQDVSVEADLGSDGTVTDHVIVTRTHKGDKSPYWWYRTTNQDYLQIFVPPGSALQNAGGGVAKAIVPPVNYARLGYATDPLILAIESSTQPIFGYPSVMTHAEFGKEVFSTWVITKAGASSKASFDYSRHLFSAPSEGARYSFVFDKQPGAQGHYKFEVNAPLGFKFSENNLPTYDYETSDPAGRVVIGLTLTKI